MLQIDQWKRVNDLEIKCEELLSKKMQMKSCAAKHNSDASMNSDDEDSGDVDNFLEGWRNKNF